ncbi:potassium channel LctB [Gracilibacillus orientalis]|uniref:Potassium channel LctB n=1 Tax=Gracilibacillus orientalis TaxID=334253 RepID=A0A1I4LUN4_9BACI|nr:potassium channel family protein [Gracilibacillus orientalis]SFL94267.1 potassium channel LctB [Gracilibacillus orientalis]
MSQALIIVATIFIISNVVYFFRNKTYKKSYFSTALFKKLFFVLFGVTFGFALLYYALSFQETVVVQGLSSNNPVEHTFGNLLYFSGVTFLTIGYGDMIPVNSARFFALIQAAIGVLLPAAYFIKAFEQSKDK